MQYRADSAHNAPPDPEVMITLHPGESLQSAAARSGHDLSMPCGGQGRCGKCRVRFAENAPAPEGREGHFFSEAQLEAGWRLACIPRSAKEANVFLPPEVLVSSPHQIMMAGRGSQAHKTAPRVSKAFLSMNTPTADDSESDLLRIERAWHAAHPDRRKETLHAPLPLLQTLGARLRSQGFSGTAVVREGELLDFEEGDTTDALYAAAFDLGTTTLAAALLDMRSGAALASAAEMNPLITWGDDVISRITAAAGNSDTLKAMQAALLKKIARMLEAMAGEAGIALQHIYEIAFAGNTTMEHLLCGVDPAPLGQVPFVSAFSRSHRYAARHFGLPVHSEAECHVFPVIGGFVGGDTVAALLATDFDAGDGIRLLMDAGTNGELVLAHGDRLWAASTAAGPAFEGARISRGMRAARGAVEGVLFRENTVSLAVIGGGVPRGICGSGLIDLCGEMLRTGVLDKSGCMCSPEDGAPFPKSRLRYDRQGGVEFVLYSSESGDITVTQQDIRELQLGTAALRAGMTLLLRTAGLSPEDLDVLFIAGGFGSYIRMEHACRIGLIPEGLAPERVCIAGNAALSGVKWASVSTEACALADSLARRVMHIDLSTVPDFAETFVLATLFPDTEPDTL